MECKVRTFRSKGSHQSSSSAPRIVVLATFNGAHNAVQLTNTSQAPSVARILCDARAIDSGDRISTACVKTFGAVRSGDVMFSLIAASIQERFALGWKEGEMRAMLVKFAYR